MILIQFLFTKHRYCTVLSTLDSWAKFKQEPKSAAVKGDPLKTNAFSLCYKAITKSWVDDFQRQHLLFLTNCSNFLIFRGQQAKTGV